MMNWNTRVAVGISVALAACAPERETFYRGGVHDVAQLAPVDAASAYRAALGGSFNMSDPSLWILVDTLFLPRTEGLEGGVPVAREQLAAIRALTVVKGTCTVPVQGRGRDALVCPVAHPGYAARFSQPFALGPDSVQVHVVVEQYAIPRGPQLERLRFERAYHVVKRGATWRAVREGRLPRP
jgi:hypothetical protein